MITIMIIIVIMMMCWTRRTGATTWRSFPPLQMIIAIIIVMFDFIFFCCSIWTLIRVCVGHSTSIIPLPRTSRGLTHLSPQKASVHPCTLRSVDVTSQTFRGVDGGEVGGGEGSEITLPAGPLIRPPFSSHPSSHPPLQSIVFSASAQLWLCPFF